MEKLYNYLKMPKSVSRLNNRPFVSVEYIYIDVNMLMDELDTIGRYLFLFKHTHLSIYLYFPLFWVIILFVYNHIFIYLITIIVSLTRLRQYCRLHSSYEAG